MAVTAMPDDASVRDALREVDDPEAGMNIVELGLVYRVEVDDRRIEIDMTMTTPACPVADSIVEQARDAVRRISPEDAAIELQLVWDPVWNPSMMSGVAKDFFGWPGR